VSARDRDRQSSSACPGSAVSVNLARLDLVSVRLAVLCAELGSLSAAARRIHCSLSTASYRLSALEETFGTELFTRDYHGLHTTEAGERFVHHAKAILEHVESMHLQARSKVDAERA
jgi:DNA-binding transcriptional LysR family regulator